MLCVGSCEIIENHRKNANMIEFTFLFMYI